MRETGILWVRGTGGTGQREGEERKRLEGARGKSERDWTGRGRRAERTDWTGGGEVRKELLSAR